MPLDFEKMWKELTGEFKQNLIYEMANIKAKEIEKTEIERMYREDSRERLRHSVRSFLTGWIKEMYEYGPFKNNNYPYLNTVVKHSSIDGRYDLQKTQVKEIIIDEFSIWLHEL